MQESPKVEATSAGGGTSQPVLSAASSAVSSFLGSSTTALSSSSNSGETTGSPPTTDAASTAASSAAATSTGGVDLKRLFGEKERPFITHLAAGRSCYPLYLGQKSGRDTANNSVGEAPGIHDNQTTTGRFLSSALSI